MKKILDRYQQLLTWLLVATVAILIIPVTMQMLSRVTELIPSYIWTEELSRFLLIWMIMIGAMMGVREGTHFDVDVWPDLAPKPNAVLRLVSQFFMLLFALVFVFWGFAFLRFGWNQDSELAELPMLYIFIAWPLTGLTWLLFLGESFRANLRIIAGKDPE